MKEEVGMFKSVSFCVDIVKKDGRLDVTPKTLLTMYDGVSAMGQSYSWNDTVGNVVDMANLKTRVIYDLKSSVKVTSGKGTSADPYTLGL